MPELRSKTRIWTAGNVLNPGQTQRYPSDRFAQRSADGNNGIAYLKKPGPTRAVEEDEPLPSPEDRPLNQPQIAAYRSRIAQHRNQTKPTTTGRTKRHIHGKDPRQ